MFEVEAVDQGRSTYNSLTSKVKEAGSVYTVLQSCYLVLLVVVAKEALRRRKNLYMK